MPAVVAPGGEEVMRRGLRWSRTPWPMMAGVFVVGAAVGAADVPAMDRRRCWERDGLFTSLDAAPQDAERLLSEARDDAERNGTGARTPHPAVSMSATAGSNAGIRH
jgi:hypothetical protein